VTDPIKVEPGILAILDDLGVTHAPVPRQGFIIKGATAVPMVMGKSLLDSLAEIDRRCAGADCGGDE
jgi:hypothetical protein